MSREGIVERAEAPQLRRPNPLFKWLGGAVLLLGGLGILALLGLDESEQGDAVPRERPAEKSRGLQFGIADFELPTFSVPAPETEPAPEAPPPALAAVPPLPPPEAPGLQPAALIPPPVPVADAPAHEDSPEEIAKKRRLASALSGSAQGATSAPPAAPEARKPAAPTLDLRVTKTQTAVATRLQDLTFTIPKGAQIGCILNTAIQSAQTGLLSCTLPADIYGADGAVVLLDRGSQAIGEYKTATLTYGKRRIYVVWSQIRTPTGVVIDVDAPGTGPLGRAGLSGHIDNHYLERVGIPLLMSIVSFGGESYVRGELTSDNAQYIQSMPEDTLGPVANDFAQIKPTLHKNQGALVNIFVARDLDLSSVYALETTDAR